MKLDKFSYLYSKPLGNHTLKIMKKIPGNLLKNLEKSWKYHGILSVQKSGNPEFIITFTWTECFILLSLHVNSQILMKDAYNFNHSECMLC